MCVVQAATWTPLACCMAEMGTSLKQWTTATCALQAPRCRYKQHYINTAHTHRSTCILNICTDTSVSVCMRTSECVHALIHTHVSCRCIHSCLCMSIPCMLACWRWLYCDHLLPHHAACIPPLTTEHMVHNSSRVTHVTIYICDCLDRVSNAQQCHAPSVVPLAHALCQCAKTRVTISAQPGRMDIVCCWQVLVAVYVAFALLYYKSMDLTIL